jgi:hypothetical protein
MAFGQSTYRRPRVPAYPHPDAPKKPAPKAPAASTVKITGDVKFWTSAQTVRDTRDGSTKTTRFRAVAGGVVVNTCTRGPSGMCEALVFIPGAKAADFLPATTTTQR